MLLKKKLNIYIFIAVVFSIYFSKILWGLINVDYVHLFEIPGEYSNYKYNPINESIRYIVFISLPLIVYLGIIKFFKKKDVKKIKKIFFYNKSKKLITKSNKYLFLYFYIFLTLILLDFLSFKLPFYKLDFFHEGQWLTPGINYLEKGGYWTSSYVTVGFFYEIFNSLIGIKIFDTLSIGSARFSILLSILIFKITLIIFVYNLTIIQKMNENLKIIFFVFTSLVALSMTNFNNEGILDYRELPLFIFLTLLIPIISNNKMSLFYCFLVGSLSVLSMMWGIDRGAYLNLTLLFLVIFLLIKKDFNKTSWIVLGLTLGWFLFYKTIGSEEFKSFIFNTKEVYLSLDWIHGIIHPEPFSSDQHSTRATKILMILILGGLLTINLNFFKYKNLSNETKILLIFLLLISIISYRTALGRSDGPHIAGAIGIPLFSISIIAINLFFNFILENKKYIKKIKNLKNIKYTASIIFTLSVIFIFLIANINLKNIVSFKSRVQNYVHANDNSFLTKEQILLVKKYSNLISTDKCVQIFTYDAALPYLVRKPTCNKYYFIWSVGTKKNQNLFIDSLINNKPNFMLLNIESNDSLNPQIPGFYPPSISLPLIHNFIENNYDLHENFLNWSIYKIK